MTIFTRLLLLISLLCVADSALGDATTSATPFLPLQISSPTNGQCLVYNNGIWANGSCSSGGGGVTSVALSDGSTTPIYCISGSPVTTTGTLVETLCSQTAGMIFAGPSTGSGQPAFTATPYISGNVGVGVAPGSASNSNANATLTTGGVIWFQIPGGGSSYYAGIVGDDNSSGASGATGKGTTMIMQSGNGVATNGSGGDSDRYAGNGVGTGTGGAAGLGAGNTTGSGNAGTISLQGGAASGTGHGGGINITGGTGSAVAGSIVLTGGELTSATGTAGAITGTAGEAGVSGGTAGPVTFTSGFCIGGSCSAYGGAILNLSGATAAQAGSATITAGAGSTTAGSVILQDQNADNNIVIDPYSNIVTQLSTTASRTDGFFYLTESAGTPTGTPGHLTGGVYGQGAPVVFDTTNNQFCAYNAAWKCAGTGTASQDNTGTSGATIPLLNGANTWSGLQKFTNADLGLLGTSTGYTLLESGLTSTTNNTLTLPTTATDTLAALGTAQTFSVAQTMSAGLTLTNAANAYAQTSTGLSITSGTTGFGRDITGTVNDSSAVDGIIDFANITCTLCTGTSYLVDWQVGGTSEFKVTTGGGVTAGGIISGTNVTVTGTSVPASPGLYKPVANVLGFASNGLAGGIIDVNQHWRIGANTPTIASGACGATTNGTLSAAASDQSGEIIIGSATTATCTITFGLANTTAPRAVILQAANAAAATALSGEYVSSISTTAFVITGTLASTSWYYWVQ